MDEPPSKRPKTLAPPAPFNQLSTDIIQKLQALLVLGGGQKEAARSALISKWCEVAWSTRSVLDFNDVEHGSNYALLANKIMTKYRMEGQRVESFKLWSQEISHDSASYCIRAAMELGARNVSIFVGPKGANKFELPKEVLQSPQLLSLCAIGCTVDFRPEVRCLDLQHLQMTELNTYGDLLDDLVIKCRKLEKLEIGHTEKITRETQDLSPDWESKISKSRLHSLDLVGVDSLENISRGELWVRFPLLKSVEIQDIHSNLNWDHLSINNSSLEQVSLNLFASQLDHAKFDLPNIREFKLVAKSAHGVDYFKTSSVAWMCDLDIECAEHGSWFSNLRTLLKKLNSAAAEVHLTVNIAYEDAPAPQEDGPGAQDQQSIPHVKVLDIIGRKEELVMGLLPLLGWSCKTTNLELGGQPRPDLLLLLGPP